MPTIGESITLKSSKPNFERDQVKLLSDLRNARVTQYDLGHIVYCIEDGNHYKFNGESETFSDTTGYFRLLVGGVESGGSECSCEGISIDSLSDILI